MTFEVFELQSSLNCDHDYLEIREESGVGKLIGVYCSEIPPPIESSKKIWMKLKTDDTATGKGFLGEYSFLHGNELTGSNGEIASPLYPQPYLQDEVITWRITVEFGMSIKVVFDEVRIENYYQDCEAGISVNTIKATKEISYICYIYVGYSCLISKFLALRWVRYGSSVVETSMWYNATGRTHCFIQQHHFYPIES